MENTNSLNNRFRSGIGNSWKLGTFWGIPVKVHWTFGLLILFVSYSAFASGDKLVQGLGLITYVLVLFLCVILHEYGHALTAKKYGVYTKDIIISPIGGLARLESMPEKAVQEFFIAIAGPMVNLIIGLFLAVILYFTTGRMIPEISDFKFDEPIEFIRYIIWMNFALFLFNLIPAFPMDGGRILRSLLSIKLGKVRATKIAAGIGRIIAIVFVIIGIFNQQLSLSLIGLFIFMMAGNEYDQTKILNILGNTKVKEIMRTSFTRLHLSDYYTSVIEKYYREGEQNFLVFDSMGNVSGSIPELFIKDTIKTGTHDKSVNQLMSKKLGSVNPEDNLKTVIEFMRKEGIAIVSVIENDNIIGVLDRNNIENHIRLKSE
ncbi:MAG: M50 family metallopeptidase [Saprospiraceae bacterium]|nr:M50 family metallopeptidase [Saprospiraceae bacterium]